MIPLPRLGHGEKHWLPLSQRASHLVWRALQRESQGHAQQRRHIVLVVFQHGHEPRHGPVHPFLVSAHHFHRAFKISVHKG